MADTIRFELVSPERLLMSEDVAQVDVPGAEGDFGVLPQHVPAIATLRAGILAVRGTDNAKREVFVRGGFADVRPDMITVLAEQAIPVEEIDEAVLAQEIQNAEEDVADARDELAREKAQRHLDRLQEVIAALKAAGHG
ncbi:F0F1 ATP synthase subunit epsilon [Microbaculum marinisediminis]|uniref:ATP synthase epsilon chain n=1 Tax=Microbaculum marinisediminis TaxID=2931392 RepID=A0AAW5R129_9HYPH|nr:F0F1 ATP synthase subunit epsilon [Microbaculum sp. A6E488]MCT8972406.1 F0F1 ATP synthase subunit epsilon [Microbaculum sp. A6E488]